MRRDSEKRGGVPGEKGLTQNRSLCREVGSGVALTKKGCLKRLLGNRRERQGILLYGGGGRRKVELKLIMCRLF